MRPSREDWLLTIAKHIAKRGTCPRAQVGAVIVQDGRIISMGYNGSPPGEPHCDDEGCKIPKDSTGCVRTVHAEANAIAFAARGGVSTEGAVMYCTHGPCYDCAKLIVSSGIKELAFIEPYRDTRGSDLVARHMRVKMVRHLK